MNLKDSIKTTDTRGRTLTEEMTPMDGEDQGLPLEDHQAQEGLDMTDTSQTIEAGIHPGEGTHLTGDKTRQDVMNPSVKIMTGHTCQTGVKSTQGASDANVRPASRSGR